MTAAGTFSAQRQQNRFILQQLAKRDRNKRDASSFLGQFWQVLNPFIYMIVMVLIFSDLFGSKDFVHYPIYVLSGTIPFGEYTGTIKYDGQTCEFHNIHNSEELGIVIILFGHALNLFIGALGAYVHTCRLHYVEFFGKFYEGGGREFEPFKKDTKFVNIVEEGK